jgi:hypothetical protein
VDSATSRRVQFDLFQKHGLTESFVAHPDLNYIPVNVRKSKPSTAFPLLARAYCKTPDQDGILPIRSEELDLDPRLRRKSSYSKIKGALNWYVL